jgi:hypothetical protein
MAKSASPLPGQRPNIASAAVRFPAVRDYEQVDREIGNTLRPTLGWFAALGVAILAMLIGATAWTYQIHEGLGAAGYQPPVMWGVYIVTFVFWVGIGHAGTLISAILYLFRAGFRTSIYRVSDAACCRSRDRPARSRELPESERPPTRCSDAGPGEEMLTLP